MTVKKQTRKRSIRTKILVPAALLVVTLSFVLGLAAYLSIRSGMVSMGVEEAGMAVTAACDVIDGDLLAEIVPGCEDTETYRTLLDNMRRVQRDFGIAYLYTLYTDGRTVYYGVDTDDSSGQCAVGDKFDFSYAEMAGVFGGEAYAQDFIDHTGDGDLISAYLPIRDSSGRVAGVVGCDYDAANVVAQLRRTVLIIAAMSLLCMASGLAALNLIVGRIMKNLNTVNRKVYNLVHSDGDLTQQLDVKTGDELEEIAGNVNIVLGNIAAQAEIAHEVADGNLTVQVRPKSEKDLLGNALAMLVARNGKALRAIRSAAEQAKSGTAQVATASDSLAQSAMAQAGTIQQITSAMSLVSE